MVTRNPVEIGNLLLRISKIRKTYQNFTPPPDIEPLLCYLVLGVRR